MKTTSKLHRRLSMIIIFKVWETLQNLPQGKIIYYTYMNITAIYSDQLSLAKFSYNLFLSFLRWELLPDEENRNFERVKAHQEITYKYNYLNYTEPRIKARNFHFLSYKKFATHLLTRWKMVLNELNRQFAWLNGQIYHYKFWVT